MADLVLALETSCDETAAAVLEGGRVVRSSVVSSQVDLHARYGGVVPEIAGRAHLATVLPVVEEALEQAGLTVADGPRLRAIGATVGPGLVGSLLVGVSVAKALALAWGVPFVGVNHLEGHLYASLLEAPELPAPAVVLLVSGGHTLLVALEGPGRYHLLGGTLDDAAGEAFDKVARYLGLGYPGGPALEAAARTGDPTALSLPRPMLDEGLDLSFSGLKTAVVTRVRADPTCSTPDVAASFQEAVVDVLVHKALAAVETSGARAICLAGGVGANGPLRARLEEAADAAGLALYLPSRAMCTDNAAMIAAAAAARLDAHGPDGLDAGAEPSLRFPGTGGR